jgi:hypothetical protein
MMLKACLLPPVADLRRKDPDFHHAVGRVAEYWYTGRTVWCDCPPKLHLSHQLGHHVQAVSAGEPDSRHSSVGESITEQSFSHAEGLKQSRRGRMASSLLMLGMIVQTSTNQPMHRLHSPA